MNNEHIHLNINKPEYHNVLLSDKRSKIASVFDGKQYVSAMLDETIDTLDSNMKCYVTDFVRSIIGPEEEEIEEEIQEPIIPPITIPDKDRQIITKQMKRLNDLEPSDELQKRSNKFVQLKLFDNRETVKDTKLRYETRKKQLKKIKKT